MRYITPDDIDALAVGSAILGAGGGGNPYIGRLHCLEELKRGARVPLVAVAELPDDAVVMPVGGIGAPAISIEKLEQGGEGSRAVRAVEEATGLRATALISAEIGGANSMAPIITAAQLGVAVVDGDGMGRAFPEMQMTTFSIYGHRDTPAAVADERGNVVVFRDVATPHWFEKFARTTVVAMGGTAVGAEAPMTGEFVRRAAVPGTVSRAIELGRLVLDANRRHEDPVPAVCAHEHGVHLMDAKIVDLRRHLERGFSVGEIRLEGLDRHAGSTAEIVLQNEYLTFRRDGVVEVAVPDLVVLLDLDTGHAITTDVLRYGQRVAVLGLPCHDLLKTPRALAVVGPAAFGLEGVEYRPLPHGNGAP
jgi:DUF917 family protein